MGKIIADLINLMVDNNFVKVDDIIIVGYSFGANAAGFAGKNIKNGKIKAMFGLDPPGLLFNALDPLSRLTASDAQYVEVIHTRMRCRTQRMFSLAFHSFVCRINQRQQILCQRMCQQLLRKYSWSLYSSKNRNFNGRWRGGTFCEKINE